MQSEIFNGKMDHFFIIPYCNRYKCQHKDSYMSPIKINNDTQYLLFCIEVMGKHCCVKDCTTKVQLPSHFFPKDVILVNKWKKAINSEDIEGLTYEELRKCVVCYRHFADNDYEAMYRLRRLKPGVIPSVHLPKHSNNNSEISRDNNSETSNSKNSNIKFNIEQSTENVTATEFKMEITTDTVESMEIVEIIDEQQSLTEVLQSTNDLLNGNPSTSSPPELKLSELIFQKAEFLELKHVGLLESGIQEAILPEQKLSEACSSKLESCSSSNSTRLLELHNMIQGKHFDKSTSKISNLYRLCCMLQKKQEVIAKRQLSFHERIKQAKRYSKKPIIEKLLASLTPIQQTFLQKHIKVTKYAPKVCN